MGEKRRELLTPEINNLMYQRDRSVPWFIKEPQITWPARNLLIQYSGYAPQEVEKEVIALRDRAWETYPYPCISQFDFLNFDLSLRHRVYNRLLNRLLDPQRDAKFLDIACCLGHDIRKLIFDGVPGEKLFGVDLQQGYIDLGYELFRDRDFIKATFLQGDLMTKDDDGGEPWTSLEGRFDVVNLGMILHMWTYEEQIDVMKRAIQCGKAEPGTTILGIAVAVVDGAVEDWIGKKVPAHNVETFKPFMKDVEKRTGTKWKVDAELDYAISAWAGSWTWVGERCRRLLFELTRLE